MDQLKIVTDAIEKIDTILVPVCLCKQIGVELSNVADELRKYVMLQQCHVDIEIASKKTDNPCT